MVKALLLTKNIKVKSHKGLISKFGEIFVNTNLFPKEYGKLLKRAYELRITGDYEFMNSIEKIDAEKLLKEGKEFAEKIKTYLMEKK